MEERDGRARGRSEMPRKECRVMDERLQVVAELGREFENSPKTGYKIFDGSGRS
jgi:hypothetical protein